MGEMMHFKIAYYEYRVDCIWMGICLGICDIAVSNPVYLMVDCNI